MEKRIKIYNIKWWDEFSDIDNYLPTVEYMTIDRGKDYKGDVNILTEDEKELVEHILEDTYNFSVISWDYEIIDLFVPTMNKTSAFQFNDNYPSVFDDMETGILDDDEEDF